eukprot:CAMPEP_0198139342 /NCGR_PEP_ID=MMETSP1443-20131203/2671_1 /TAXON_ID=186043 /ORGANISM="Entomoneis sp., Strain CCMP2396" /LENGTH=368 /DNA_ID=CAMNT_0043801451 /DNA_START=176 /DNA_END=1282 /DNA_ORIENTATION=-
MMNHVWKRLELALTLALLVHPNFGLANEQDQEAATTAVTPNNVSPKGKDCLFQCENGGLCEFVSEDVQQLRHIAQAGGLIQRCRCPPGWGGVVCEIPIETCNLQTRMCDVSGRPCDKVGNQWSCHCNVADKKVGNFASTVCRRGYTEYCSDYYDPDGPLYFCTNGGKCNSDYLSARERPGDLTVRRKYMAAGCMCNENFHGERCEKLLFDFSDLTGNLDPKMLSRYQGSVESIEDGGKKESTVTILAGVAGLILLSAAVFGTLFWLNRRRLKKRKEIFENAFGDDLQGRRNLDHSSFRTTTMDNQKVMGSAVVNDLDVDTLENVDLKGDHATYGNVQTRVPPSHVTQNTTSPAPRGQRSSPETGMFLY